MGTTWSKDDDGSFSSFPSDASSHEEATGREQQRQVQPPPSARNGGRGSQQPAPSSQPPKKLQQCVVAGQKSATVPQGAAKKKAGSSSSAIKKPSGLAAKQDSTVHVLKDGSHGPQKKERQQAGVAAVAHKKRALKTAPKGPAKKARVAPSVQVLAEEKVAGKAEDGTRSKYATTWLKRYQDLVTFHSHHGHCRVPQDTTQHASLAGWCLGQKKRKEKQKLSADEIRKLDRLGIEWTVQKKLTFEERCQELEAFQRKFNNLNIPSSGGKLGGWLYSMKRRRLGKYKRRPKLTQQQIDRLDKIGIDWSIRGRTKACCDDDDDADDDESSVE